MGKLIICSVVFLLFLLELEIRGQGMVPLSEVIDHDEERKTKEDKVLSGKKLSEEKVKAHMKIAGESLKQDDKTAEDKVTTVDKPVNLQNPAKHASEDFILKFLLKQYPRSQSPEEQVEILSNLENFAHKFENGRDLFKSTSALKEILLPALNSSSEDVRKQACGVFAISAQNNLDVQEIAVQNGVTRVLIHLMTFDSSPGVRGKALFAVSAIIRNFPKGQTIFIHDGGINALVKVATFSETRKRALNLITDLLEEKRHCRDRKDDSQQSHDDAACEDFLALETTLKSSGFCEVLRDIISNIPGFDLDDQIMTSDVTGAALPLCKKEAKDQQIVFQGLLFRLKEDEIGNKEEIQKVENVLAKLADNSNSRDEL